MSNPSINAAVAAATSATANAMANHNLRNAVVIASVAVASALGFNYWKQPTQPQAQQQIAGMVPVSNTLPQQAPVQQLPATGFTLPQAGFAVPAAYSPPAPVLEQLTINVVSVGRGKDGSVYLNSSPNYRAPGNQSIRITNAAGYPAESLIGRQVTSSGRSRVDQYGGRSITVNGPGGLNIR